MEELSQHSKEVAKGSLWSLAGMAVFNLTSFFYTVVIARAVSQDELGLFFLSLGIVSLGAIVDDLGLSSAIVRYVPFFEGSGMKNKIRPLLRWSYLAVIASALLLMALIFWQADNLGAIYKNDRLPAGLRLLTMFLLLTNILGINLAYLRSRVDIKSMQITQNLQNVLKLVFVLILLMVAAPSESVLSIALLLSFVPPIALSSFFVLKRTADLPASPAPGFRKELFREIIPFGLTISMVNSLGVIFFSSSRLLLGYLTDPATVAVYTVASTLATVLLSFPNAIGDAFLPMISRLYGQKDMERVRAVTDTAQRWALFITIPIGLVMIAFSQNILSTIYGQDYGVGGLVMSILTMGLMIKLFSYMISMTLSAMQLVRVQLYITVVSGLVNVALNLLLIPGYGMAGSGIATFASFVVNVIMLVYFARKHFGFRFPPEILKLSAAGAITLALIFILSPYLPAAERLLPQSLFSDAQLSKITQLAVYSVVALASVLLFAATSLVLRCFRQEDVSLMKKVLQKMNMPGGMISFLVEIANHGVIC
ncbi:MAG: flippase [Candidatus Micrarchaeia archaeon]